MAADSMQGLSYTHVVQLGARSAVDREVHLKNFATVSPISIQQIKAPRWTCYLERRTGTVQSGITQIERWPKDP